MVLAGAAGAGRRGTGRAEVVRYVRGPLYGNGGGGRSQSFRNRKRRSNAADNAATSGPSLGTDALGGGGGGGGC